MIEQVFSDSRGKTETDWLKSRHSFSFNNYYDPENTAFGPLRVLNDDIVKPGAGFPKHPHSDMEIITIVLNGRIAHEDSTGTKEVIKEGEVQMMTAGSGIYHSEYNDSDEETLRLLQVWIIPREENLNPAYDKINFSRRDSEKHPVKIASSEKGDNILFINQDANVYIYNPAAHDSSSFTVKEGRGIYVYLYKGEVSINSHTLNEGDALKITDENTFNIKANQGSGLMLFDVALDK